jgi:hypothetical protein
MGNWYKYNTVISPTDPRVVQAFGVSTDGTEGDNAVDTGDVVIVDNAFVPILDSTDQEVIYTVATSTLSSRARVRTSDQLSAVRKADRDFLIRKTDWMMTADISSLLTRRQSNSLKRFRSLLRNITTQASYPNTVVWPDAFLDISPVPPQPIFRADADEAVAFTTAVTVSRAGSLASTRVNRRGYIEVCDPNTLRFDYDSDTRELKGVRVEAAATNLCLQSGNPQTTPWNIIRSTMTGNTLLAPDGGITGAKLTPDTTTATHYIVQNVAATNGTTYTASVFFKAFEWVGVLLSLQGATSISTYGHGVNGTASGAGKIEKWRNGWYRLRLTCVATSTGNIAIQIRASNGAASVITGNASDSVGIWGAQFEVGDRASSYIPTTGNTLTRSADDIDRVMDVDELDPESFAMYVEATYEGGSNLSPGLRTAASIDNLTTAQYVTVYNKSGFPNGLKIGTASTLRLDLASNQAATDQITNAAVRISSGDIALSNTGLTVQTSAITNIPDYLVVKPRLRIGRDLSGNYLDGHLRELCIYPTEKLTNDMLKALAL